MATRIWLLAKLGLKQLEHVTAVCGTHGSRRRRQPLAVGLFGGKLSSLHSSLAHRKMAIVQPDGGLSGAASPALWNP